MGTPRRPFPFRWVLPVCELLVSVAIVWPLWVNVASELWVTWRPAHNEPSQAPGRVINIEVPDSPTPEQQGKQRRADIRLRLPAALNVPVNFIQIPYVMLAPNKMEWTPSGITWIPSILWFRESWEDVTWPIVGMVFWWMLGRALEALLLAQKRVAAPRITLIEAAFGLSFALLGTVLCLVLLLDSYSGIGDRVLGLGGGLWAVFGLVMVSAKVIQWRIIRAEKRGLSSLPT